MTTEPEPPTVIIPSLRCWRFYAHQIHDPHLIGNPPSPERPLDKVWRCDGYDQPPEALSDQ